MLRLECPNCRRPFEVAADSACSSVPCPFCRQLFAPLATSDVPTLAPPISGADAQTMATYHASADGKATMPLPPTPLVSVRGYEVLRELGRGGMGVVYLARQSGLKRLVALKMILSGGHAGPQELSRFRAEAEASAKLRHPGIVQIYEVGDLDGLPFFSLEFVEGGSLDSRLRQNPLTALEAANLVESLARAMHHAHQEGIVHRDLKPANVLLASGGRQSPDSEGTGDCRPPLAAAKITDFGLAKKLDDAGQTQSGAIMGTPSYMAPEQAVGSRAIGPAADVYALGGILYECLTGRPPFRGASAMDTILMVLQQEPVPPSRLAAKVPRDLETIALKCLEKDSARRYASAEALADDLRRFQNGEPIQARPAGALERGIKWAKRKPAAAALLAVIVLAGVALLTGGAFYSEQLRVSRNEAVQANSQLQAETKRAIKGEEDAQANMVQMRSALYAGALWQAANLWPGEAANARALLERDDSCPPDLREFSWHYYRALVGSTRFRYERRTDGPSALDVSADGKLLVMGSEDGDVRFWNVADGAEPFRLEQKHTKRVRCVRFSPDGKLLVTGGSDGAVWLWDLERRVALRELGTKPVSREHVPLEIVFDPAGTWVAACFSVFKFGETKFDRAVKDGVVLRWKLSGSASPPEVVARIEKLKEFGNGITSMDVSKDGKYLVVGLSPSRTLRVYPLPELRQPVGGLPLAESILARPGRLNRVRFSSTGKLVASASFLGKVYVWRWEGKSPLTSFVAHTESINDLDFSPDDKLLLTAGRDNLIRLWDVAFLQGNPAATSHPTELGSIPSGGTVHKPTVVRFLPGDAGQLISAAGPQLNRYPLPLTRAFKTVTPARAAALAVHPTQPLVAVAEHPGSVALWNADTLQRDFRVDFKGLRIAALTWSPDGRWLAVAGDNAETSGKGLLCFCSADGKRLVKPDLGTCAAVSSLAVRGDGRRFVVGLEDGTARLGTLDLTGTSPTVSDLRSARTISSAEEVEEGEKAKPSPVRFVAFAADGSLLALAGATLSRWDPATDQEKEPLAGNPSAIQAVTLLPNGRQLLLAVESNEERLAGGGEVRLWDAVAGTESRLGDSTAPLGSSLSPVLSVALSDDKRTLAIGGRDQRIRLWDVRHRREVASLTGHTQAVRVLQFAGNSVLFSGSGGDDPKDAKVGGEGLAWDGRPVPSSQQ